MRPLFPRLVSRRQISMGLALLVWIGCGLYAGRFLTRGWVPHDEGTIGQSAVRVLHGEMPHRDFDDMYTGGLTYLNAASMSALGVSLRAPRVVLFVTFMAFLAATLAIARRVAPLWAAVGLMVLVTVWTVPNYFVALPSWYNLFFAGFGALAFVNFLSTRHRGWLFAAGVAGGVSVLMKIAGIFYLAGGVLVLAMVEQQEAAARGEPRQGGLRLPAAAVALLLIAATAAAVSSGRLSAGLVQILLPTIGVAVFHAWTEWRLAAGTAAKRVGQLARLAWPFAAGAAVPIVAFAGTYALHGALSDLVRGVLILPQRRLHEAAADPPALVTLALGAPCLALVRSGARPLGWRLPLAGALGVAVVWLLQHGADPLVYSATWSVVRSLPLVTVAAGAWALSDDRPWPEGPDRPSRMTVALLTTLAATTSLIQVPYATGLYFCYAVPFSFLALLAIARTRRHVPMPLIGVTALFLAGFAVLYLNTAYVWALGRRYVPYDAATPLGAPADLRVRPAEAALYRTLLARVRDHAPAGSTIWAGPDSPEVYFLGGYSNPTRAFFDFLTPDALTAARMDQLLAGGQIAAVVVNTRPLFSPALDRAVVDAIRRHLPVAADVGPFTVFSRSAAPGPTVSSETRTRAWPIGAIDSRSPVPSTRSTGLKRPEG